MSRDSKSPLANPIVDFIGAVKRLDSAAICSCFTSSAVIRDEEVDYEGDELKQWVQAALVGAKFKLTQQMVLQVEGKTMIRFEFDGDASAFGIEEPFPLDLYFALSPDDQKIQHLEITALLYGKEQMRAVYQVRGDLNEPFKHLRVGKRLVPENVPKDHVLVKITAASLNFHDFLTMKGINVRKKTLSFPRTLGMDGAGTLPDGTPVVVYSGMGSPDFRGDETLDPDFHVFSEAYYQGALADYLLTPKRNIVPLPTDMNAVTAAALGTAWLTAYRMIWPTSNLRPGQTMLVQGSTGGVATALIQLGRAAGFRVFATGRSDEKRSFALRIGAHAVFAPGEELPEKVHAVFDTAGLATFKHSVDSVKNGGTVVTIGATSGDYPKIDLLKVITGKIDIRGVQSGTLEDFKDLISFVVTAGIKPAIGKVLPFEKAEEGLRDMVDGKTWGKIVVEF